MAELEEKMFFLPGDLVTLKKDIPNKPTMYVVRKEFTIFRDTKTEILKGIRCRWFTNDNLLQEAIFNTKDITKVCKSEEG